MKEKDFIVNVGPNGTFKPSGNFQTIPADIDAMFKNFEKNNTKKISIFFHGGLVREKSGMEVARMMGKHLVDCSQTPICFVWETGLIETIYNNIGKISETKLYNKLITILTKMLASKLGFTLAEGKGAGVNLTHNEIQAELQTKAPFENYTRKHLESAGRGAEPGNNNPNTPEELEPEIRFEIEADLEVIDLLKSEELIINNSTGNNEARGFFSTAALVKAIAKITYRVIKRFVAKRDHDFYPTIIEELLRELYIAELGAWVWNNMKTKAKDMWNDNTNLSGLNQFAGNYLLTKLTDYYDKHNDIKVNLIGHSAGSIAICNFLNVSAKKCPTLVFENIIFLAPACRVDLFNAEIVKNPNRFKNFRMFTMKDEYEKKDRLLPFLYTHSLLYLVSGVLENGGVDFDAFILGLERHIGLKDTYDEFPELVEANKFIFEQKKNRIAFSVSESTAPDGMITDSETHGGFDENEKTKASIKTLLI